MQFGRLQGISLAILGVLLLCTQAIISFNASKPDIRHRPNSSEQKITVLPGLIGVGSLTVGLIVFITAHRRDEPDPKNSVK